METLTIVLMLCGAVAQAGYVISQSWILNKKKILSKAEVLVGQYAIRGPVLLMLTPYWDGWGTAVEFNPNVFWIALGGLLVTGLWIQSCNVQARELADTSWTEPIQTLTPGLVTVAALWLHEIPSWQGILGIALITGGVMKHVREGIPFRSREFWKPFVLFNLPSNFAFLSDNEKEEVKKKRKACLWAYGSALGGTGELICDALVVRSGTAGFGFGIQSVLLMTFFSLPLVFQSGGIQKSLGHFRAHSKPLLLLGTFWTLQVIFTNVAFRLAPIAYIGSMKRIYLVFVLLADRYILKSEKAHLRAIPIIIVTIGSLLLAFDGSIGRVVSWFEGILD